jgi:hypothetical protein
VLFCGLHAQDVGREPLDLLLDLSQGIREPRRRGPRGDELNEVVDASLGPAELDLLEAELLGDVGKVLLHLYGRAQQRICLRVFCAR